MPQEGLNGWSADTDTRCFGYHCNLLCPSRWSARTVCAGNADVLYIACCLIAVPFLKSLPEPTAFAPSPLPAPPSHRQHTYRQSGSQARTSASSASILPGASLHIASLECRSSRRRKADVALEGGIYVDIR
eukprot:5805597-Pleurochrysis_carterae.AAC.4